MPIGRKKAVYGCALILGGLAMAGAVIPSIKSLLATQRELTIQALEAAIARGDDGIGPLPVAYLADDAEEVADDALIRALGTWPGPEGVKAAEALLLAGPDSVDTLVRALSH